MVQHHTGALLMAHDALAKSLNPDLRRLAAARAAAEKRAQQLKCSGAFAMGDQWMPCQDLSSYEKLFLQKNDAQTVGEPPSHLAGNGLGAGLSLVLLIGALAPGPNQAWGHTKWGQTKWGQTKRKYSSKAAAEKRAVELHCQGA